MNYRKIYIMTDFLFHFFAISIFICIFEVRQFIISNAKGIFYAHRVNYIKKYREVISIYHSRWQMIGCRKLGYYFSFLFNNK